MKLIGLIILLLFFGCERKEEITYLLRPSKEKIQDVEPKEIKFEYKPRKELEWGRDPFLSMEEQGLKISEELEKITQPVLSAIVYNPERKIVIIEGEILSLGDVIDSKELVGIRPDSVVLKKEGKLYLLELEDVVSFRREEVTGISTEESVRGQGVKDIPEEDGLSWE